MLFEFCVAFPVRQGQIDDKPFTQKTNLTGRDGNIPGRQIGLHRQCRQRLLLCFQDAGIGAALADGRGGGKMQPGSL